MTKKVVHVVNDVLPWRKMVENVWEIRGPEPDIKAVSPNLSYTCLGALQGSSKYLFSNQIRRGTRLEKFSIIVTFTSRRLLTSNNSSQVRTSVTFCWLVDNLQGAQIHYVCGTCLRDLLLCKCEGNQFWLVKRNTWGSVIRLGINEILFPPSAADLPAIPKR